MFSRQTVLASGRLLGEERAFCLKLWPRGRAFLAGGGLIEEIRFSPKMDTPKSFILRFFHLKS